MSHNGTLYEDENWVLKSKRRNILISNILIPFLIIIIIVSIFVIEINSISFEKEFLITISLVSIGSLLFSFRIIHGYRKINRLSPLEITKNEIKYPNEPPMLRKSDYNSISLPLEKIEEIKIRKRPFPFNDAFFEIKLKEYIKGENKYQLKVKKSQIDEIFSALDELGLTYEETGLYG
ncbi:MAG: hypothetical protein R6V50_00665 [Thermoplasmatota archaeon]